MYSCGKVVDLHFKSAVEGVIIKWATQITEVLSADSASAFKNNQHLTPWAGKCFFCNTSIIYLSNNLIFNILYNINYITYLYLLFLFIYIQV